jgi:hypothetical protein
MPGNADGEQHVSEVDEGSPGSGSVWLPSAYSSPSQAPPPDITPRSPASTGPFNMAMDVDPVDEDGNSPALEEDGEDEHRREGTAEAPLVDLPYKDQFTVLTDLSAESQPIDSLHPQPVDVDRWELVISPAQYLLRFKDTLATVQLISRAPHRVLHPTYHRGPGFDRWLLLAQANHQLWIDPKYKDPFFNSLEHYQTAQPGRLLLQASLGNVHVSTSVFIHCLRQAGCDTIRLKAYGQKTPLVERFLNKEPAQTDHRWAEHNEWDIGEASPHHSFGSLPRPKDADTASNTTLCLSQAPATMVPPT